MAELPGLTFDPERNRYSRTVSSEVQSTPLAVKKDRISNPPVKRVGVELGQNTWYSLLRRRTISGLMEPRQERK